MNAQDIQNAPHRPLVEQFKIGDEVDVFVKIMEGDKERLQAFSGTVIGRRGMGISETFAVRRIVQGEGVERTFPIHSPKIDKVVVRRSNKVRRAKLYYLRGLKGKATRLKEDLAGTETAMALGAANEAAAAKIVPKAAEKAEKADVKVAATKTEPQAVAKA